MIQNNLQNKWLKIWVSDSVDPLYLVVAQAVTLDYITGPYLCDTRKNNGRLFKSKISGCFHWDWIKKIEIM